MKNHILPQFDINSFYQLKKQEKFIKYAYNNYKPHTGIERFTPVDYEQHIKKLKPFQRTNLEIKVIKKHRPYSISIKGKPEQKLD